MSAAVGILGWVSLKVATRWRSTPVDPRAARTVMIAAAVPTAVSLTTGTLGIWDGSNITRALLAVPLGVCAGAIVAAVATKDLR